MKKILIGIGIFLAVVLILNIGKDTSDKEEVKEDTATTSTSILSSTPMPTLTPTPEDQVFRKSEAFRSEFMAECNINQDQYEYCDYTYTYLMENNTDRQILDMLSEIENGSYPEGLVEAALSCIE